MTVLFLCVANSARSQMAEGLGRKLWGDKVTVLSAGAGASYVHPDAILAMADIGIDITKHKSKTVKSIDLSKVDIVVILCAEQVCPVVPARVKTYHWPMPDPMRVGPPQDSVEGFKIVRDMIAEKLNSLKF